MSNHNHQQQCAAKPVTADGRDYHREGHIRAAATITLAQGLLSIASAIAFVVIFIVLARPHPDLEMAQRQYNRILELVVPPGQELPLNFTDLKSLLLKISAASLLAGGLLYLLLAIYIAKFKNWARICRLLLAGVYLLAAVNISQLSLFSIISSLIALAAEVYVIVALFGKGSARLFTADYRLLTSGDNQAGQRSWLAGIVIGLLVIAFLLQFYWGVFS